MYLCIYWHLKRGVFCIYVPFCINSFPQFVSRYQHDAMLNPNKWCSESASWRVTACCQCRVWALIDQQLSPVWLKLNFVTKDQNQWHSEQQRRESGAIYHVGSLLEFESQVSKLFQFVKEKPFRFEMYFPDKGECEVMIQWYIVSGVPDRPVQTRTTEPGPRERERDHSVWDGPSWHEQPLAFTTRENTNHNSEDTVTLGKSWQFLVNQ